MMRVLLVDDDAAFRFALRKALARKGFDIEEAASGEVAVEVLVEQTFDAMLLDLRMTGMSGLDVLRRTEKSRPPTVVLTGHGTVRTAVEAMHLGAYSFLEKPVDAVELIPLLESIPRRVPDADSHLVGSSDVIRVLRDELEAYATSGETVLIHGETGAGKDVVARELHARSHRADKPFVALNAACVPEALFESELFGHEKGAFTGATGATLGLFREADGGTLFIDEVGELPLALQAKMLRALDHGSIRPVGGAREIAVDVRIYCATNRDLLQEVKAGAFRQDLYYRLQVLPLKVPPLRDHSADIAELMEHFSARTGVTPLRFEEAALALLQAHAWPGNVRELLNVFRRLRVQCRSGAIGVGHVEHVLTSSVFSQATSPTAETETQRSTLAELEAGHIARVLQETGGNVTRAAAILGIDRRTLQRKLRAQET